MIQEDTLALGVSMLVRFVLIVESVLGSVDWRNSRFVEHDVVFGEILLCQFFVSVDVEKLLFFVKLFESFRFVEGIS